MSHAEVFLTWNDSRRSTSLSGVVGLTRVVHVARRRGLARHLLGMLRSAAYLARHRPRLVWFQYSQALGILLALYRAVMPAGRVRLVADLHTKSLRRDMSGVLGRLFRVLKRFALKHCDGALVTNGQNADFAFAHYGIRPLVLHDPLPTPPSVVALEDTGPVVFVCSFAVDEPLPLLVEVARRLHAAIPVVVTGDPSQLDPAMRERLSAVAQLSGFLPESEYWRLLHRARSIVVLSSEPSCLPCGAYEAIAVGRTPVVAEDPEAHQVFGTAARYAPLTVEGIIRAIESASAANGASPAAAFDARWRERWRNVRGELSALIALPASTRPALDGTHAGS